MKQFILGVVVGTMLTTIGVHAAGKDGQGIVEPRRQLNEFRDRQFQHDFENMRKQTEQERARMKGQKTPC